MGQSQNKELETTSNISEYFKDKNDELLIRNALYKEFRELINYSYGAGIELTDIHQYLQNKIDEL